MNFFEHRPSSIVFFFLSKFCRDFVTECFVLNVFLFDATAVNNYRWKNDVVSVAVDGVHVFFRLYNFIKKNRVFDGTCKKKVVDKKKNNLYLRKRSACEKTNK